MKNTSRTRFVSIAVAVILACTVLGAFVLNGSVSRSLNEEVIPATGKEFRVVLHDDGWKPRELTIHAGDSVIFATAREAAFWPASNQHPIHNIYPAFDPRKPILTEETWSFTFSKVGVWEFHDHLFSPFTGVIEVVGQVSE